MKKIKPILSLFLSVSLVFSFSVIGSANETTNQTKNNEELLFVDQDSFSYSPPQSSISVLDDGSAYVNDCVTIFFKDDAPQSEIDRIIASIGGEILGFIEPMNQYQISINKTSFERINSLCEHLMRNDLVEFANVSIAADYSEQLIPDDPWGSYGSWSTTQEPSNSRWWAQAIEADKAWEYDEYFNHINIGIVDSGFDVEHEDLEGKISFPNKFFEKTNIADSHGTHVAGVIGAKANNNKGITGLVWDCDLICVDWEPDENSTQAWATSERIMTGFVYTVLSGAKVVNFSLGSSGSILNGTTQRYQIAINAEGKLFSFVMAKLLSKGYDFIAVQSAGNGTTLDDGSSYAVDSSNNGSFSCITPENAVSFVDGVDPQDIYDRVIIVGAARCNGGNDYEMSSFSNGGEGVSIYAPGSTVYSCDYRQTDADNHSQYANKSGTSMAAPIVTGVTSMVWSVNPDFTGAQVKKIVCDESNTPYTVADSAYESHLPTGEGKMINAKLSVEAAISQLDFMGTASGKLDWQKINMTNGISYKIIDQSTGEAYRGFTNENGEYEKRLPAGEYKISFQANGESFSKEFSVKAGEETIIPAISVEPEKDYVEGKLTKIINLITSLFKNVFEVLFDLIKRIAA